MARVGSSIPGRRITDAITVLSSRDSWRRVNTPGSSAMATPVDAKDRHR
ncbi:MAG: hypothetical protein ACK559_13235 [bacterium]